MNNLNDIFFAPAANQELTYDQVLEDVQRYFAENHASTIAEAGEANAERATSLLKELMVQYIVKRKYAISGLTTEHLCEQLYEDMAGYSFLKKWIYKPGIEEVNLNAYNDIEVIEAGGRSIKIPDKFSSPQHAIDVVRRMLNACGMVIDDTMPSVVGFLDKNIRISVDKTPIVDPDVGINASIRIVNQQTVSEQKLLDSGSATAEMLHFLMACIRYGVSVCIAGSTGSGKSVCINSLIVSLLYKSTPDEVRFLMIDPKVVELGIYNGIPQLLVPVVTDPRKAAGALSWAVTEMLKRYKIFAENNVRDLAAYNRLASSCGYQDEQGQPMQHMPQIVIIIDELADLMMAAPNEVEDSICRLAQMARAAGMHLVIATQRPSVDVITGIIKANIPSRIAFAVSSQVDSRTILDMGGAEKLLGRGDMLFSPVGSPKPIRIQGCFVSDSEIESIVNFIKKSQEPGYDASIAEEIEKNAVAEKGSSGADASDSDQDPMMPEAIKCVVEAGQASTSLLQRRLRLGYARAGRLIDEMEQMGVVGPHEGSKPRQVLITYQQWLEMNMRVSDEQSNQTDE